MNKDFNYYMTLPYTIEILPEQPDGWYAAIKELPGCMTTAETAEEALAEIQELKEEWIHNALEDKFEIPEPRDEEKYSGNFRLRVPKNLHRKLVEASVNENVSLNTVCVNFLAEAIGSHSVEVQIKPPKSDQDEWNKALQQICEFMDIKPDPEGAELAFANWVRTKVQIATQQNQTGELQRVVFMLQKLGKASPLISAIAEMLGQMQHALEKNITQKSVKAGKPLSEQAAIEEWEERTTETVIKRQVRSVSLQNISRSKTDIGVIDVTQEYNQISGQKKGR